MKVRDKIARKRQSMIQDEEKPFMEHLEDLRKMITRMFVTLMIAVIGCFLFNEDFFKLMMHPLRNAGLDNPKEYKLPKSVKEIEGDQKQQDAWWRIHGTARGMADLDGAMRESFVKASAPDDFTRQYAYAMLLHHAADTLPKENRTAWISDAVLTLPEGDREKIKTYAAELAEVETAPSLEKPRNFVEMEAFAPAESFMLSMKLSLFAGIIVSFPLLFFFLLEFILPGMTGRERKMMFPALSIGFGLFLLGVAFAWFIVVPQTLEYFHDYSQNVGVTDNWRIGYYLSFVTSFTLIFGLIFETPVVIMVMVKLGLLTSKFMRNSRGWAVIIILVISAIITPTGDMLSMSFMAAPMAIMFETCIWLAWWHERKAAKREAEEQRRDEARRAALVGVASVQAARPDDSDPAALPESSETKTETEEPKPEELSDIPSPAEDHPHHPEPSPSFDDDYDQYLRDHAGYRPPSETHTESVPVGERQDSIIAEPEEPKPSEEPSSEPKPEETEPKPAQELTPVEEPKPAEESKPADDPGGDPKTQNQT